MYVVAILYPDIEISMTAQTKDNAAKLMDEKHREIMRFYPAMQAELDGVPSFTKDSVKVAFKSGGRIDILANHKNTRGSRRRRLMVEESALLDKELFEQVLEPVVNIPRRTAGKGLIDPQELNGQINYLTTAGFRGSDEWTRSVQMVDDMAELKGMIVLGSDWQLAVAYNRGETRSKLLAKKAKLSPITFAMEYGSRWTGCTENALVDINKLLELRTLTIPELKGVRGAEYILGVDVARSAKTNNNQTSVVVLKLIRNMNGNIIFIDCVNLYNISNSLSFSEQAIEVKRIRRNYQAKVVAIDCNGLGSGLNDYLCQETFDPLTHESLGCWGTMNTETKSEVANPERIIYEIKGQSLGGEDIICFMDMVMSGKLRLLERKPDSEWDLDDKENIPLRMAYINTDFFIEEVSNLRAMPLPGGKFKIEKVVKKYDKDRYSAMAYALWYIKTFEEILFEEDPDEIFKYLIV